MPFYDFHCKGCEQDFTVKRSFSQMNDPAECPHCHGSETERQISLFYATNTGGTTAAASSPNTKVRHI